MIKLKSLICERERIHALLPQEAGPRSKNPSYLKDGRKVYSVDGVDWVRAARASAAKDKVALINVQKFDEIWSQDQLGYYFPPGHTDARTERFIEHLEEYPGYPIVMPEVAYYRGTVGFTNGRHRYSYFRDKGVKHIYVCIEPSQSSIFKKLFS